MSRLPEEFEQEMKEKLGDAFPAFMGSLNDPAPVSIRLNPKKNALLLPDKPVPWSAFGKYLQIRPIFTLDPRLHAGAYYVQEASSMFIEQAFRQLTDTGTPLNVLDLCAAPGGKSTHILSLIGAQSLLVSNEVIRSRASVLAENIQKWGYGNSVVTSNDPDHFQSLPGFFDVMMIDAPCSGEGLFRKDHEAAEEWSPQHVALCASRQKRIIADAWPALKEHGILIYSTCTYNEQENEDNLLWLQQQHGVEFMKLNIDTSWGIQEVIKGDVTGYRFFPHRVTGEGFFMAVMRKQERSETLRMKIKKDLTPATKKVSETLQPWMHGASEVKFLQWKDLVYAFAEEKLHQLNVLHQHLKIVHAGTPVAALKHDKLIPEHALAMSTGLHKENFKTLSVDHDEAIRYLRRDTLTLPEAPKGYHLIMYEDVALGWVNSLGNRFNNMYPVEWRIRMQLTVDKKAIDKG
jgi:16S rRNA C967 or C1407 C5-methylase (RsmB/RsmF family)/NOL1/NOP2/fmu family ribosome biogenesis protein